MRRVLAGGILVLVVSCSSSDPPGASCPSDLPSSCPMPVPSYTTDIVPIIQGYCYPCHGPGGIEQAQFDYTSYMGVYRSKSSILDQVYSCQMPPLNGVDSGIDAGPATALPESTRVTLLSWLVCGAPEN